MDEEQPASGCGLRPGGRLFYPRRRRPRRNRRHVGNSCYNLHNVCYPRQMRVRRTRAQRHHEDADAGKRHSILPDSCLSETT